MPHLPTSKDTPGPDGRAWLEMRPRDFDAAAGPEADYSQDALFPAPDPYGTTDLLDTSPRPERTTAVIKTKLITLTQSLSPARRAIRPERLHILTDERLAQLPERWKWRGHVVDAVTAELERRDRVDEKARRKAARMERRRAKERALQASYQDWVEASYLAAEAATRGHMLNAAGRAAGVDPRSLFSGQWSRARKYASQELAAFWETHPRITYAQFKEQSREAATEQVPA